MEVHHHPNLHHQPKKWKEYFLEFLMIFLAVSMGFIAENIRENLVNKEKELNYIENLVRDLKEEKAGTIKIIHENELRVAAIDTFVKIRNLDFSIKANSNLFFSLFVEAKMWGNPVQTPNEITLSQIKATGGLNIIRPRIANLIAELDMSNQNVKWGEKFMYSHGEETFRMIYELTDYPAIWDKNGNLNKELPPLLIDDKKKLMKFFNLSADLGYTIDGYVGGLKNHLAVVDNLIQSLEVEYHLDKKN
jgi:hypothetical protein